MQKWILLGVLLSLISLLGCDESSSELVVSVKPKESPILYSDYQDNCYQNTISMPRFIYQSVNAEWKGSRNLRLISLQIKFPAIEGAFDKYNCAVDGDILAYFGISGDEIEPGQGVLTSICPLMCGGLSVSDQEQGFSITGEVVLTAVSVSDDGREETPVTGRTSVTLTNDPL